MSEEFLTCFGGAVKSLGRNKVGGRVITFSDARSPDKVSDYFDANTEFWDLDRKPILYRHGQDSAVKRRRFGSVELTKAADGIWAEGRIDGADEHSRRLLDMVEQGEMKWSTGSSGHLVERTPTGGTFHVDLWVISECSLCEADTVCETRNLATLKSLAVTDFDTFAPRSRHAKTLEARARAIHVRTLIDRFELSKREFERSQVDDERSEMQKYYDTLAQLSIARYERVKRG